MTNHLPYAVASPGRSDKRDDFEGFLY